jgi:hypothetical protein
MATYWCELLSAERVNQSICCLAQITSSYTARNWKKEVDITRNNVGAGFGL